LRFVTSFLFFSRSHSEEWEGDSSNFATTSLASENESAAVSCVAAGGRGAGRDLRWRGVAFGEGEYPCNTMISEFLKIIYTVLKSAPTHNG